MQPQPSPVDAELLGRDERWGEIGIGTGIGRYPGEAVEGGEGWYPPPELRLPELWLDEPWLDDEWPLE